MVQILTSVGTLGLAYIIICIMLYFFQEHMIFYEAGLSASNRIQFEKYKITINRENIILSGWFVPGEAVEKENLLIYYGGNAEEVSGNLFDLQQLPSRNSYLFVNYRGYGDSTGTPSEKNLCEDAIFIIDTITKQKNIALDKVILMGRSIGSGVATYVAHQRPVRGVILVTPFDSLKNVAQKHYPIFPVGFILKHKFNSFALAPTIQHPVLILTANRDRIVPERFAQNLARHWQGPVEEVSIKGASHNDIHGFDLYWQTINSFIEGLDKITWQK